MGPIWEPFWAPSWPKIASSHLLNPRFLQKVDFQKNERHRGREHDFDPKTAPKTTQDRPKTAPRRSSRGVFFASIFIFDFGRSWVGFWLPKGRPKRAQIGHFWHRFFIDFYVSFQDRPKSGQEPPRASQEPPKSAQERPKSAQERPNRTQNHPRVSKKHPKSTPRAAQERPRAPQESQEQPRCGQE